ncbi:hypothetical protein ACFX11_003908 [Malus domestica]
MSTEQEHPKKAFGWAARDSSGVFSPFKFSRRETGDKDVMFKVLYCGICHSDLHMAKNEWGMSNYPLVPGHEIVGVVIEVGSIVQKFNVGDKYYDGTTTYGGYSDIMVANEHFIVRIPDNLPLDGVAPLLCAGITTYSPLRYFGLDKPVPPLVRRMKQLNISALIRFLVSRNEDQMQAAMGTLDGIIDTVSALHPLLPLIGLLKSHRKLVMVGAPEKPPELSVFPLLVGRKIVAGSNTRGMKETQEMIDFAAKHNITADIEVIPMDYVNIAMERLLKADVKYRLVIDIGNTLKSTL